jgi:hypothetical protein
MNNLAASLAQQRPPPSFYEPSPTSKSRETTRQALPTAVGFRAQGALWARKALALSQAIVPPDRTEECDMGCAVATHNLGEFAEAMGQFSEASKLYREAESLAKGIGFDEGIKQAREGLTRVSVKTQGANS